MTEKIRQLKNEVRLSGQLTEIAAYREGVTQEKNTPYISFRGKIQCGPDKLFEVPFKCFVKSKKSDGSKSVNYINLKKWISSVMSTIGDEEHPVFVDAVGSLGDNPFCNQNGELVEATEYNLQFFSTDHYKGYKAEIDLEGFIYSLADENVNDEATGRQKMRFISRDIFGNTIDVKDIIIPEEIVRDIDDADYKRGATTTIYIRLDKNDTVVKTVETKGGFGNRHNETNGTGKALAKFLDGGEAVVDSESERALSHETIKAAMDERVVRLEEIKSRGYLGGKSDSNSNNSGFNVKSEAKFGAKAVANTKADPDDFMTIEDESGDDDVIF